MFTDRLAEVIETRVRRPGTVAEAAAARRRAGSIVGPGRLVIVAADHPPGGRCRPAGSGWPWPTGRTCSSGSAWRWAAPA